MLALLLVQFLLGIDVNLYVKIPQSLPGGLDGAVNWAIQNGPAPLPVHVILGFSLVWGALGVVGLAIAARDRGRLIASGAALVGILFAAFSGVNFVSTGDDAYSFRMAIGFVIALASYGSGLIFVGSVAPTR